jgi:hypothetical protein
MADDYGRKPTLSNSQTHWRNARHPEANQAKSPTIFL